MCKSEVVGVRERESESVRVWVCKSEGVGV